MESHSLQGLRRMPLEESVSSVPSMVERRLVTQAQRPETITLQQRKELREKLADFEMDFCRWCRCW